MRVIAWGGVCFTPAEIDMENSLIWGSLEPRRPIGMRDVAYLYRNTPPLRTCYRAEFGRSRSNLVSWSSKSFRRAATPPPLGRGRGRPEKYAPADVRYYAEFGRMVRAYVRRPTAKLATRVPSFNVIRGHRNRHRPIGTQRTSSQ